MKQKTAALFLISAAFASAQTLPTYTSPAGAIPCSYLSPYLQHYWLVENSTPPYPGDVPTGSGFFMPPMPNHPWPVSNGICPNMGGFVSGSGLYTAVLEMGTSLGVNFGLFRIKNSAGIEVQVVQLNNIKWAMDGITPNPTPEPPSTEPAAGQAVTFTADGDITGVCAAECSSSSGHIHLEGQWAWQWQLGVSCSGAPRGGCPTRVFKLWKSVSPVVIVFDPPTTSEPVEIFF